MVFTAYGIAAAGGDPADVADPRHAAPEARSGQTTAPIAARGRDRQPPTLAAGRPRRSRLTPQRPGSVGPRGPDAVLDYPYGEHLRRRRRQSRLYGRVTNAMVMQSINPATEEVIETFDEFSPGQVDSALQQVYDRQKQWRTTSFAERTAGLKALARCPARREGPLRRHDHRRDGQADRRGRGRGREVRLELRLLRRERRALPAPEHIDIERHRELRRVRAARRGAGDHAVELPVLAGDPLPGAGADGRQHGGPEARLERAAFGARHRGGRQARPACRRACSGRCWCPAPRSSR